MIIIGPFWFVNFFITIFLFIYISFIGINKEKSLKYIPINKNIVLDAKNNMNENKSNNNIEFLNIIDRDFFNSMPVIPEEEKKPKLTPVKIFRVIEVPIPPEHIEINNFEADVKNFLPPLQLTIKGTILTDNPRNNTVFIENNRTNEEKVYTIGDLIEDSQIVFIGKTKIIFIRSNGQQEIIYVNKASQYEEERISKISYESIFSKSEESNIIKIDLRLLEKKISTIGNFLDELGLITYFEKDFPIGCQVGIGGIGSLAYNLGLMDGDIIKYVDGISVATQNSRILLYESFLKKEYDKEFLVDIEILRNNETLNLTYELFTSSFLFESNKNKLNNIGINEEYYKLNRSDNKKYIIDDQVNKGDYINNHLNEAINNEKIENLEKGSKKNVLYRNKK